MKSIIYQVVKEKTTIKGFWKDDAGKVYVDNIKKVKYSDSIKHELFEAGELSVFYTKSIKDNTGCKDFAVIENSDGSVIILNNKIVREVYCLSLKIVRQFIDKFGGVTIYRLHGGRYLLEAWTV